MLKFKMIPQSCYNHLVALGIERCLNILSPPSQTFNPVIMSYVSCCVQHMQKVISVFFSIMNDPVKSSSGWPDLWDDPLLF